MSAGGLLSVVFSILSHNEKVAGEHSGIISPISPGI